MMMNDCQAWTFFYGAIVGGRADPPVERCAEIADRMLVEWRKRWRQKAQEPLKPRAR